MKCGYRVLIYGMNMFQDAKFPNIVRDANRDDIFIQKLALKYMPKYPMSGNKYLMRHWKIHHNIIRNTTLRLLHSFSMCGSSNLFGDSDLRFCKLLVEADVWKYFDRDRE